MTEQNREGECKEQCPVRKHESLHLVPILGNHQTLRCRYASCFTLTHFSFFFFSSLFYCIFSNFFPPPFLSFSFPVFTVTSFHHFPFIVFSSRHVNSPLPGIYRLHFHSFFSLLFTHSYVCYIIDRFDYLIRLFFYITVFDSIFRV